jgi:glycosyltransferase involved in cell wall biosynthesis
MKAKPRVAFFTDSYLEVNGVAHTSRMLAAFARGRELPFLCVHGAADGARNPLLVNEGSLRRLELPRTKVGFKLDADLRFDLLMLRHAGRTLKSVREFNPDVIHITGPNDIGLLGAYVAHRLRLPVVMSWHTNLHEYAARRLTKLLPFLPDVRRLSLARGAEQASLKLILQFYRVGKVLLAPNEELGGMLGSHLHRPVFMMRRGVDSNLFSPVKRARQDAVFTIGYVGRLTPEKNVRLLAGLESGLRAALGKQRVCDFRFVLVGAGSEREWLERQMQTAVFTGVLKGEALARAYANFDVFIFPSHTDTFGNVVLEAQASGVPAIVSDRGGPKFNINTAPGWASGLVAGSEQEFLDATLRLMRQPDLHATMRVAARQTACRASWDNIFEQVYQAYEVCLQRAAPGHAIRNLGRPSTMSSDALS